MIEIFTTPGGLTLSYERRGSGSLLVCHPGGPGGSAAEFEDFAGLDDTFELVLFSPRGSHGSDPADDYALASYVADLEALREHVGVERFDLLGFSHGGIVAVAYAAAHGDRVGRLLLVDTPAVWGDDAESAMRRGIESRSGEPWFAEAKQAIEDEHPGAFSSVGELIANLRRQMPLYFHRWEGNEKAGGRLAVDFAHAEPLHYFNTIEFPNLDLRGELRSIEAPTLVVLGDDDFIAGPV
ncbi:MAG TPA: alpha/beta hydrolase, partial [Gaiellaceae bacterium]|nr:alpha/beta hydrolase [Gaiellaceae bacterium]